MPTLSIKDHLFGALLLLSLVVFGYMKYRISGLEDDKKSLETQIAGYDAVVDQAAVDANKSGVRVQERIKYIEKTSAPIYKYIETYKGDANASDCDNNISLLRSFSF